MPKGFSKGYSIADMDPLGPRHYLGGPKRTTTSTQRALGVSASLPNISPSRVLQERGGDGMDRDALVDPGSDPQVPLSRADTSSMKDEFLPRPIRIPAPPFDSRKKGGGQGRRSPKRRTAGFYPTKRVFRTGKKASPAAERQEWAGVGCITHHHFTAEASPTAATLVEEGGAARAGGAEAGGRSQRSRPSMEWSRADGSGGGGSASGSGVSDGEGVLASRQATRDQRDDGRGTGYGASTRTLAAKLSPPSPKDQQLLEEKQLALRVRQISVGGAAGAAGPGVEPEVLLTHFCEMANS